MSTNIDFDEKEVEKLLENAGKSKSTLAQQRQRQAHLMSFLEKMGPSSKVFGSLPSARFRISWETAQKHFILFDKATQTVSE